MSFHQDTEHYFSFMDYRIIGSALEFFKKNKDKNQMTAYSKEAIKRLDDLIAYFHIHQKKQFEKEHGHKFPESKHGYPRGYFH